MNTAKKRHTPRRQAVLVLGMHRSGTSALSGMLAKLGVQPPKSLMVPTQDNPRGYWESTALMRFHDQILASAGTVWSDWDQFNPAWMGSAVAGDLLGRLPGILEQEYGDARLLLIKDPRISRLLPLWLQVLADLKITPKIILPMRHPLEVASSLEARNEFGRNRSYLAWLRHMLDAEYHSRGCKRIVIDYADILMDWRKQAECISAELDVKWPKWSGRVEADIDGFLTGELRHHDSGGESTAGNFGISGWISQAHDAFMQIKTGPTSIETLRKLDHVRMEFNKSSSIYAAVVRECEVKAQVRIKELNDCVIETSDKYTRIVNKIDELVGAMQAGDDLSQQSALPAEKQLTSLIDQLHAAQTAHAQSTESHAAEIDNLSSRLAIASQAATAHEVALVQSAELHAAEVADLSSRLEASQAIAAQAATAHEVVLVQSAKLHAAEVADLSSRLEASQAAVSRAEMAHRVEATEASKHHASEIKRMQEAGQQAEESLQARFAEIAKLTAMVFDLERDIAKERALRAGESLENSSKVSGLEHEIDLHRGLAVSQLEQLRCMQESRLWKIITTLHRLVRPSRATPSQNTPVISDSEMIRQSKLFDNAWYLRHYPDVGKRGVDPLKHYLRYGASEGRNPSPGFSTRDYLRRYPDVAASDINPLLHYIRHGIGEGRTARGGGREGKKSG